jgi:hypothetical protein
MLENAEEYIKGIHSYFKFIEVKYGENFEEICKLDTY